MTAVASPYTRTALREAAHATLHFGYGDPFAYAEIAAPDDLGPTRGIVQVLHPATQAEYEGSLVLLDADERDRRLTRTINIALAGIAASLIADGLPPAAFNPVLVLLGAPAGHRDLEDSDVWWPCACLLYDDHALSALSLHMEQLHGFLARTWHGVQALAAELTARRRLSGEMAFNLLRQRVPGVEGTLA